MINLKLCFGKKELIVKFQQKRGRPKRTLLLATHDFIAYLKRVYQDNRFQGNRFSRVLRRVFEAKKIKEFIGVNLAVVAVFSSTITVPNPLSGAENPEQVVYSVNQIETTTTINSIQAPLSNIQISQGFSLFHRGIDLRASLGTPISPIKQGTVEAVNYHKTGYGYHLIIEHSAGMKSLYAHLSKINVKPGSEVYLDTIIGTIGSTGWSTGPHLHLEIWQNNQPINPVNLIPNN